MKVAVIGGGIGGLLSGVAAVKQALVDLFEEHGVVGYPKHCTGIVSETTLRAVGGCAVKSVITVFSDYRVLHTALLNNEIVIKLRERVYLLDRPLLESELLGEFQSVAGGHVYLSTKVTGLDPYRGVIRLSNGKSLEGYDVIVLAEGVQAALARATGLCRNKLNRLKGLQALVRCENRLSEPHVVFGGDVSEEFFGWVVPIDEHYVIAGLADRNYVGVRLRHLINKYLSKLINNPSNIEVREFYGGLIPISKPCKPVVGRVVGVGDSVSAVKPLSGGGIYCISRQVKALENALALQDLNAITRTYYAGVRGLINLLKLQHLVRGLIISKFGSLHNLIYNLMRVNLGEVEIMRYDTYIPNVLSVNNLMSIPKIIQAALELPP